MIGTYVWSIGDLERLITMSNVDCGHFEDKCLIPAADQVEMKA